MLEGRRWGDAQGFWGNLFFLGEREKGDGTEFASY